MLPAPFTLPTTPVKQEAAGVFLSMALVEPEAAAGLEKGEVRPKEEEAEGGGQLACRTCNKVFSQPALYEAHLRTHDGRMWECSYCGKKFTTKYFLKKHRRLHTGETPYSCSLCGKTFAFQQSFHKHMLYHTDEKPHTCTWEGCGRAFKELSTLQNHERIHSGERPFVCETCGKSFRQRVSYLVHRRIHTGVLPYTCTSCGKKFRYKVTQRTHRCRGPGQEGSPPEDPNSSPRPLAEDTALLPVPEEIRATLEQLRAARGRRQLSGRLQGILDRSRRQEALPEALPGRQEALPGRQEALPGRQEALPGALPGRQEALPELTGLSLEERQGEPGASGMGSPGGWEAAALAWDGEGGGQAGLFSDLASIQ